MIKLVLLGLLICTSQCVKYVNGINIVDNQILPDANDCFERILLEAMLLPERTYRKEDINSVMVCQDVCASEREQCQSFSFGINARGNGTCLLSSQRIEVDAGTRRVFGTTFDPDFDIYQRSVNCPPTRPSPFPRPNLGRPSNGATFPPMSSTDGDLMSPVFSTDNNNNNNIPVSTQFPNNRPTLPINDGNMIYTQPPFSSTPTDNQPPPFTTIQMDNRPSLPPTIPPSSLPPGPGRLPPSVNRPDDRPPPPPPALPPYGVTTTTNRYPNSLNPYPFDDRYPHYYPERNPQYPYPNKNYNYDQNYSTRPPASIYGMNYPYFSNNDNRPQPMSPMSPMTPVRRPPPPPSYNNVEQQQQQQNEDKLNFYGNIPPTTKPMLYEQNYPMPNYEDLQFTNSYAQNVPGINPNNNQPSSSNNQYSPISSDQNSNIKNPMDSGYTQPFNVPTNNFGGGSGGYTPPMDPNRPSSSYKPVTEQSDLNDGGYPQSNRPSIDNRPTTSGGYPNDIGTNQINQRPEGNYHIKDEPIIVYFNPDDYYPMALPCFRRALAGKRVSDKWVRRTLICERIEECQKECSHEKRFTCEGFNYRIDPSGHGQGVCELIDVPIDEIDLYSSYHNRDQNLINHPDYDYYERDRNACRPNICKTCIEKPYHHSGGSGGAGGVGNDDYYHHGINVYYDRPTTYKPPFNSNYFKPHDSTAITNYRPLYPETRPISYDIPSNEQHFYKPRPPLPPPPPIIYQNRPSGYESRPPDYDRYDVYVADQYYRPEYGQTISSGGGAGGYGGGGGVGGSGGGGGGTGGGIILHTPQRDPYRDQFIRPIDNNQYVRPLSYRNDYQSIDHRFDNRPIRYIDRDDNYQNYRYRGTYDNNNSWGTYGGTYGGSPNNNYVSDFWGLQQINDNRRQDNRPRDFNYFDLGGGARYSQYISENAVWKYPGSYYEYPQQQTNNRRGDNNYRQNILDDRDRQYFNSFGNQWTRRPGQDECSVKSSEGFRLHKGVIKMGIIAPTVTECERMCYAEGSFKCVTYSYRYSVFGSDNCLLCDRPVNLLDYYADIEPDRDYDIYSMSDDPQMCSKPRPSQNEHKNNAQCFFRAIDTTRFYKSIVRDSLNVRSIGECELECIKSLKFTCRAFAFRYGPKTIGSIIDNCQLSDWPVRDMDRERHLILDADFDVFERASYGHGCEIQPIIDEKHKKLCYLGYGSPAKLLSSAIKKVVTTQTELECKNECIRFRENTPFKCYSFSFSLQPSTFNCEMSDLDQTELKLNVHYTNVNDRDFWLFAWNPFDWTCRDKVTTIGSYDSDHRANGHNDRRIHIFEEPGINAWTHFTVTGKACRIGGNGCEKNHITGFYSCEIEGAEIGSWDYCCKSDHPCGYSQGFEYPWCFVGDDLDQWRTCSAKYFPFPSPNKKFSAITYTTTVNNKKKGNLYHQQSPPKPGGLQTLDDYGAARLWPITYLYNTGPPNSTDFINYVDCNKELC